MRARKALTVGDAVTYRGAFLRSAGWYTNVPRRGKVLSLRTLRGGTELAEVLWSTYQTPMMVNVCNILRVGEYDPN